MHRFHNDWVPSATLHGSKSQVFQRHTNDLHQQTWQGSDSFRAVNHPFGVLPADSQMCSKRSARQRHRWPRHAQQRAHSRSATHHAVGQLPHAWTAAAAYMRTSRPFAATCRTSAQSTSARTRGAGSVLGP
jgi:hypothetical protein